MTARLKHLGGLAAGLAHDDGLGIEEGHWAWSPERNVIRVPAGNRDHLTAREKGSIAHEAAHVRISRYLQFPPLTGLSRELSSSSQNAIEDCRVHEWLAETHGPEVARWLKAVRAGAQAPRTLGPSAVVAFLGAACVGEIVDYEKPVLWTVPAPVDDALEETREARRRYAQDLLPAQVLDDIGIGAISEVFDREVVSLLREPVDVIGQEEATVLIAAARAWRLAEREIAPAILALWRYDLEHLEGAAASNHTLESCLRDGRGSARRDRLAAVAAALRQAERRSADTIDPDLSDALDAFISRSITPPEPGGLRSADGLPSEEPDWDTLISTEDLEGHLPGSGQGNSEDLMAEAMRQVPSLVETMRVCFRSHRPASWQRGFRTGSRLNLPALMQTEANPSHDRIWMRRTATAAVTEAQVIVLIDLSGSMTSNAKIEHASAAVVAITLAFQKLPGLTWEVLGFQDQLIEIARKGPAFDPETARAVMLEEVQNRGARWNDDGPCLLEAAARMPERSGLKRVIMVLSDGQPNGRRSEPEDLERAVRDVTERGITVIGIGVGAARHVTKYYPISDAKVPLAELGQRMASLLKRALA